MAMVIEVPSEIMINHDLVPKAFSLAFPKAFSLLTCDVYDDPL